MFRLIESNSVKYYRIDSFEESGLVRHGFTTRIGGVSENEFSSMNFRMNCADKRENVLQNYGIICRELGIDPANLVLSNQVHEDKVIGVTKKDCGNGISRDNIFESADGLITDKAGVALVTSFADCVPLFFLDPKKRVIALAHSGWKGTVKNIAKSTVCELLKYGSEPENLLAAIGPSIGECCFEVGSEVAEIFKESGFGRFVKGYGESQHVNLQAVIYAQLLELGIPKKNITDAGICTACNSELLFSHRKTKGRRGNMVAILELK